MIQGSADIGVVQEVVPLLFGVAGHRGNDDGRFRKRLGDLLTQGIDFSRELVDDDANVVGDLPDFVFVVIGQELPDLFQPGQRITNARQQIQDRSVDRVDLSGQ